MQERLDEEIRDSHAAAMAEQENEVPQLQFHNVMVPDEAWHIKRVANQDIRIVELQRYMNRVIQYLTYCILGQARRP